MEEGGVVVSAVADAYVVPIDGDVGCAECPRPGFVVDPPPGRDRVLPFPPRGCLGVDEASPVSIV